MICKCFHRQNAIGAPAANGRIASLYICLRGFTLCGVEDKTTILSEEAIAEFKRVYHSEFGEVLSEDHAQEMALRVLRLFDFLSHGEREPSAPI